MESVSEIRKQRDELVKACECLISALYAQAQFAHCFGGEIAVYEGNLSAWNTGMKAIANVKKDNSK